MKVPTGGKGVFGPKPASAFSYKEKGQQIRCNSEADGHSPDERERSPAAAMARGCLSFRALILVLTKGKP